MEGRFYRNKYPSLDEVVMVKVKSVEDIGAYVTLLEYGGIEGMIALSELTRRKIRSLAQVLQVGKIEPVCVLEVNEDKGYIDLSRRKLLPNEAEECRENYGNYKSLVTIMNYVSSKFPEIEWEDFMERALWSIDDKYQCGYRAYKMSLKERPEIWDEIDLPDNVKDELKRQIFLKLKPNNMKIQIDFEITCNSYEGILGIQYALRAGLKYSNEKCPFKIVLVASPKYKLWVNSSDFEETDKVFQEVVNEINSKIIEKKGEFKIIQEIYATELENENSE